MLAISPCPYGWVVDEKEKMSYLESSTLVPNGCNFSHGDGDKVKKLNHNASERDRRKKMNTLYAKLGSLLPPQDHSKKVSIPATISRMLKYIPELRNEVERLMQKRDRFISTAENSSLEFKKHIKKRTSNSATRINDDQVVIQISMPKAEKGSLSEAISRVEEEGFLMVNASSFQSFEGRLFYNMHFQAQLQGQVIDAEKLKEKVWP